MKHFLITLFLILFLPLILFAQKSKISGTVVDSEGLPIELAFVQVRGTINGAMTNEKGYYSLSVSTGDSCTFVFSCIGYNKTQRIVPSVDGDMTVSVRMRSAAIELDEAVVTRSRINMNTVQQMDPSKLRTIVDPYGGSIESQIVTFGMGVSSSSELTSQYSVRGGNYDENIVYVNGTEVYRPLLIRSGQQEGLSFINPDMTGAVRFSSGGYDACYGDKMSSVLDVTYKKPETFEGAVTAGMLGANAYVGSTSGRFTQVTGFRYKRGTTLLKTLDTEGDYDPTFMDFQTYMTYTFSPKFEISLLGNFSRNIYNFTPSSRSTSFGTLQDSKSFEVYYDGGERDEFTTYFGSGSMKYNLNENNNLALQFTAFESHESENYDIGGEYWLNDIIEADGEKETIPIGTGKFLEHARDRLRSKVMNISQLGTHKFTNNTLLWALGYQKESIHDRIKEWEMRDSMGYSLPYNEEILQVYRNLFSENDLQSNRFSGYIQNTYKFRIEQGLFSATLGLRASYWDYNNELIVSPRGSVGFVPSRNQNLTFRLASGLYYQSPFYKEFRMTETDDKGNSYIVLNKDIKSQRSIHFVLGSDYTFYVDTRPFKLTTEVYYKKMDDLVPYTVNDVKVTYYGKNAAKGYAAGVDLKLFGQFVPGTDSWINFSLMKAEQEWNGKKTPLPTDQRYSVSLFFTDYWPNYDRIKLSLKAIWADGLPFSSPDYSYAQDFRSKAYRRIDMGLAYRILSPEDMIRDKRFWGFFKNIWLGVDIFNLLDIKNVSSYSWISDINGRQWAVPNYLTGRQINFKLVTEF
ncbi:TonB-dependent receptor [Bacteroidia bacterium]|nr:TonB-dependent receptor [Bacteroidia bacterium]GHV20564.1 TonB-dependent receptor [Bacteroidia bacterium]